MFNLNQFENKKHQFPTTPLADDGIKQAKRVAERFESIPIDIIYASSYTRAQQTAEIINKVVQKEIITTDQLIERKNPSILLGKDRDDPDVIAVKKLIRENMGDPSWHDSDEENFHDFKNRVKGFIQTLENQPHENVLVVSHGYFLSLLVLTLAFEELLTPDLYTSFLALAHTTNTGITMYEYKNNKWRLLTWNDYAHLGE
jgi:probable phosphoglycerate mutase